MWGSGPRRVAKGGVRCPRPQCRFVAHLGRLSTRAAVTLLARCAWKASLDRTCRGSGPRRVPRGHTAAARTCREGSRPMLDRRANPELHARVAVDGRLDHRARPHLRHSAPRAEANDRRRPNLPRGLGASSEFGGDDRHRRAAPICADRVADMNGSDADRAPAAVQDVRPVRRALHPCADDLACGRSRRHPVDVLPC